MKKKKWQNAEILELGVESTKEETNDNAKLFHKCQYCHTGFLTKKARDEHEMTCFYKPASPGFGPSGNVTPGLDAAPIS